MQSRTYYQERLREALSQRIDKNPRTSLRAFAKILGISPTALSLILSGKRTISTKLVERILSVVELSPEEQKKFIASVLEEKYSLGLKRISPKLKQKLNALHAIPQNHATSLGLDELRVLSDWYHFAIIEMTASSQFKPDLHQMASRLGISELETKMAIDRLIQLEILEWKKNTLVKTNLKFDTKDKTKTSHFHRKRQKQILEKSIQSLDEDPIETRNHSSVTVCVDPKKLPEAKLKIQKFMWELSTWMTDGNPEQVYEMNFSLFPLEKPFERKL